MQKKYPSVVLVIFVVCSCAHMSPRVKAIDSDGDGQTDYSLVDIDGDGREDGVDRNNDGKIDAVFIDVGDKGRYHAIDSNGDKKADGGDFNEDGIITFFDELGQGAIQPTGEMVGPHRDLAHILRRPSRGEGVGEVDFRSFLPTPGNQGKLNSCAAWTVGLVAAYERGRRESQPPIWPSTKQLYDVMLKLSGMSCPLGCYIHTGLNELVLAGATTMSNVPYRHKQCTPPSDVPPLAEYRISNWLYQPGVTRNAVRDALDSGRLVIFETSLPDSFKSWSLPAATNPFKSNESSCTGQHCSGHAMVIVGYSNAKGAYLIQNSWGTDWGLGGYAWWNYEDLEKRATHSYVALPITQIDALTPFDPKKRDFTVVSPSATFIDRYLTVHLQFSEPAWIRRATIITPRRVSYIRDFTGRGTFALFNGAIDFSLKEVIYGRYQLRLELELRDGRRLSRELSTTAKHVERK